MGTLILVAILIGIPLGLLLEALFLYFTIKIFKIENATYKTALIVSAYFLLMIAMTAFIIGFILYPLGIKFPGNIVGAIVGFFISNFLYKNYYQTDIKKNIKIYITKLLLSGVVSLVIAIVVVVPARIFIVQPFFMSGASMEPNLTDGDYVLINEFNKDYKRGDIVVFKYPKDEKQFFLKRIIGLPGEKVEVKQGIVSVNGRVLDESSYLKSDVVTKGEVSLTLGSDEYFVMGDNRGFSGDSRVWGAVKKSLIVGKYWTTLYKK